MGRNRLNALRSGRESGYSSGVKDAFDKSDAGTAYSGMGRRISKDLGKIIGKTGEGVGSAVKKGSSALRQAAEDNPGGLGVTAAAAGLGALALGKMLRKRKSV